MAITDSTAQPLVLRHANLCTPTATSHVHIHDASVAIVEGRIAWLGEDRQLPARYRELPEHDCDGRLLTPGLIDCHTHLVYAGDRAQEFSQLLHGAEYADIATAGGGIMTTVNATRAASEEDLLESALRRVDDMLACGVTSLEIKSGYGLTLEHELKLLRVIKQIRAQRPVRIRATLLALHKLPPEFEDADSYVTYVCDELMPAVIKADLADAVDAFCDQIAFSRDQVERLFVAARAAGLPLKLHAEQLSNQRGSELAVAYQALSVDHLEYLEADGIAALAASDTVAVMLPCAFYTLRETRLPPVTRLLAQGVPVAVASDCNPGTAPMTSLLLAMNMACTLFRMTPLQVLAGTTLHAAQALGISAETGSIEVGKSADLACWDLSRPEELAYLVGVNRLHRRYYAGQHEHFLCKHH
jgi:imidazolonepropionase